MPIPFTPQDLSAWVPTLLGRTPARVLEPSAADALRGRTVLVTGGGGSIGSALCRQIAACGPARLVVFDIAENPVYDLQNELLRRHGSALPLSAEIGSVRDERRLDAVFSRYRPQIVFHAAAHKHVPLMENAPGEAVKNNVFGTYHTAAAARRHGAEKFVLISTDKAVRPSGVMGATKNLCEQMLQAMHGEGGTVFTAVRFGNVLGSCGSVLPLFCRQIADGGPVTITDARATRYFMTVEEAVQLVLEAAACAENGQICVLDMGDPVRILDLAERTIRLCGRTPHTDIRIVQTGLRPGEKLHEQPLIADAGLCRTGNDRIFIEQRPTVPEPLLLQWLDRLRLAVDTEDPAAVKAALHALVPTYRPTEAK